MSRKPLVILAALSLSLLLRADSCTTVDRSIDTVVNFPVVFDIDVSGNTAPADTVVVTQDLSGAILAALEDIEGQGADPDTLLWVGTAARFVRNEGFDTERDLQIWAGEPGAEQFLLISKPTIPDNRAGRSAIVFAGGGTTYPDEFMLELQARGAAELNRLTGAAFAEYDSTGDITTDRILSVSARWQNERTVDDPPDDFTLQLRLNFQVVQRRETEVYNP